MSRELDARIHSEVMGLEPERIAIATRDGGESSCASVDRLFGPWHSEGQLRAWLEDQHSRGLHKDCEIGEWLRYPRYSTSIADAWLVVATRVEAGWLFSIEGKSCHPGQWCVVFISADGEQVFDAVADTAAEAICLAALAAMERNP